MTPEKTPPTDDIDVMHNVDYLRIERMSEREIYLAGYTDDDVDTDYRYWVECSDDGLTVIAEEEYDAR